MRRRDGKRLCLSFSAWAIRDASGGVAHIEGMIEDITGKKRMESERNLLAAAVEQASEGVAILSGANLTVEYANPAFGALAGVEREGILGREFFNLFAKQDGVAG